MTKQQQTTTQTTMQENAVSVFGTNELLLNIAEVCNIDQIKGINYDAMNDSANFLPYALLIMQDELAKNEKAVEKLNEKLNELPKASKRNASEKAFALLTEEKISAFASRNEELQVAITSIENLKMPVTSIAACWAFAKGTTDFGKDSIVQNRQKISDCLEELRKLCIKHDELIRTFANEKGSINEPACHGQVYKDMKSQLCDLFTALFNQNITANQQDVCSFIATVMYCKVGVNENSNSYAKYGLANNKTMLRKACALLCDKLARRQVQVKDNGKIEASDLVLKVDKNTTIFPTSEQKIEDKQVKTK